MIISKTPLRISFAGGGTDLPSFYKHNDHGAVLSTSIDSYLYVTLKKQSPLFFEKYRLNYSETELVKDIEKIKNPIIRESLKFMQMDEHLYISTISDIPGFSGLGSSSSFCVGLLNALYKYKGNNVSSGRLAEEAAYIEIEMLKRPMGKQDHYVAAYGGLNYFRFNADGTVTVKPIMVSNRVIDLLFQSMLSFWTGMVRPSESVLAEQDKNHSKNIENLSIMRQQAEELSNLLCSDDFSIERFGKVIHAGWQLKRRLASQVSNPKIDKYYDVAIKNGACGGKISGAGSGGFLNIFAKTADHSNITNALQKEGVARLKLLVQH